MARQFLEPRDHKDQTKWRSLSLWMRGLMVLEYLFVVLMAGLIAALVVGFLDHQIRQWCWLATVLFMAIGIPLGIVRPGPPDSTGHYQDTSAPTQPFTVCLGWQTMFYVGGRPSRTGCIEPKAVGILQSGLILTIVGLALGAGVGFAIILVLASLALSPFTPDSWRQSLDVGFLGISTESLLPWIIIGVSMAAGSLIGMLSGVVLSLCGRVWKTWHP